MGRGRGGCDGQAARRSPAALFGGSPVAIPAQGQVSEPLQTLPPALTPPAGPELKTAIKQDVFTLPACSAFSPWWPFFFDLERPGPGELIRPPTRARPLAPVFAGSECPTREPEFLRIRRERDLRQPF